MSGARRRFRFLKEIAEGGFGKVYMAEQMSADGFSRIVAVKLLHAKWSSHDEVVMRTRDEARLLGLIRHPNIVKVEDLSSIDGKCAIVMEYLEGVDLKWMSSYLQDRSMEFPRASLFEIMLGTCSALEAAYNGQPLQGGQPLRVIHRDIKPSNIFVTVNGAVKVLDFGTARANFAEREAKTQALAFGSQGYMAPERMLGEEDTPAADVFSLGITLYELLTGESYGRIPPRPNKFAQKVTEKVESVKLEGDPDWKDQVKETLRLMLSYEPSGRPTAAQLVDIFELLAQNAGDMGLRRFCRTLVAEAKANEPDIDTGDPLSGSTIEEDASSSFAIGASGPPPAADASSSDAFGIAPPPPDDPSVEAAPPPPRSGAQGRASQVAAQASGPIQKGSALPGNRSLPPDEDPPKKGGGLFKIVAVLVVLLLGITVLGGVVVAAGAAVFFASGSGGAVADTQPPKEPEPPKPEPPKEAAPTGGRIVAEDSRPDVPRTATVLSFGDAAGGEVTIAGGVGFKAEWDGKGSFDLGKVPEGTYRTNVTPAGGAKVRNKTFEVVGNKKSCAFSFDPGAKEWTGGCQ